MPRSNENSEALRRAEAAEAIARGENEGMALVADDDGTAKPKFTNVEQAFDAGVNAGYAQCLEDMKTMVDRQYDVHQQRMRGVRVNL